jgi:hypothetical protein
MLRFRQSLPHVGSVALPLIAALGAFLSGCGFAKFEQREPWRAEAEIACMKSGIVQQSQWVRQSKPIDGPGVCGLDLPLKVAAFQIDPLTTASSFASMQIPQLRPARVDLTMLKPESAMTCPMVAWTDDWVNGSVQPAAQAWFGQGIAEIRTAGTYSCRRRNHNPGARLSEHAFGNAIDVMSFVLADGNIVTVKGGWRGSQQEQGFLRDVLHGACQRFKTVLGPGADALHYDHFHFDLARHDARGTRRYCRPRLSPPERPLAGAFGGAMPPSQSVFGNPAQRPGFGTPVPRAGLPAPGQPQQLEVEEDFDPRDFDITSSLDLPRPRRGILNQPLPKPSSPLPTTRSPSSPPMTDGSPMRPNITGHLF